MEWILFIIQLEMGFTPNAYFAEDNNDYTYYELPIYIEVSPEFVFFDLLKVGGTMRVNMFNTSTAERLNFTPVELSSLFYIEFNYEELTIGWRHLCSHPIIPWNDYGYPGQDSNKAYDQLYIRFRAEFK